MYICIYTKRRHSPRELDSRFQGNMDGYRIDDIMKFNNQYNTGNSFG